MTMLARARVKKIGATKQPYNVRANLHYKSVWIFVMLNQLVVRWIQGRLAFGTHGTRVAMALLALRCLAKRHVDNLVNVSSHLMRPRRNS